MVVEGDGLEEQGDKKLNSMLLESEKKYVRILLIGILLVMIGIIIMIAAEGFGEKETSLDYYAATLADWVIKLIAIGTIIYYVGYALLLMGLLCLALLTKDVHPHVRIALLIAFSIVFGSGLHISTLSLSPYFW